MIRVLLVRHGETDWNAEGRMQGRTDIPLAEAGIRQSLITGALIRAQNPQQAHVSTLVRTQQTLEHFGLGFGPTVWDELCEIGFGEWEGMRGEELRSRFPEQFMQMRAGEFSPAGAETNDQVTERMRRAFFQIVRATSDIKATTSVDLGFEVRTTVVVSHGTSLRLLLTSLGLIDQRWWVPLTNAATTIVEVPLQPGPVSSTLPKGGLGDDLDSEAESRQIAQLTDERIQSHARLRLLNLSPELLNPAAAESVAIT